MDRADIGVVIPAFNRASLLEETLASVVSQTVRPRQIILVDDGSKEDLRSIVNKFPEIQYIKIENSGVMVARTTAIAALRTSWIAFCDSDDLWAPDKLERQCEVLEKDPTLDYCFSDFRLLNLKYDGATRIWDVGEQTKFEQAPNGYWELIPTTQEPDSFSAVYSSEFYCGVASTFQPIFPSTVLLSKEKFDRIGGFDLRIREYPTEDFEFTLRCIADGPAASMSFS